MIATVMEIYPILLLYEENLVLEMKANPPCVKSGSFFTDVSRPQLTLFLNQATPVAYKGLTCTLRNLKNSVLRTVVPF